MAITDVAVEIKHFQLEHESGKCISILFKKIGVGRGQSNWVEVRTRGNLMGVQNDRKISILRCIKVSAMNGKQCTRRNWNHLSANGGGIEPPIVKYNAFTASTILIK